MTEIDSANLLARQKSTASRKIGKREDGYHGSAAL
jgi:hypothetical protein